MKIPVQLKPLLVIACGLQATFSGYGLSVTLNSNPNVLAGVILGSGVTIANPTFNGDPLQAGTFTGGASSGIGINSGIILSTGNASDASGLNNDTGISTPFFGPSDPDLDNLSPIIPVPTYDAAVFEFDFTTTGGNLSFRYVFASDEYSEFINQSFNDRFGFFVDGQNIALLPGTATPVSINTINGVQNPQYFIDNPPGSPNLQYDGLTVVLTAEALGVAPGTHHMKLAIEDASDPHVDSAVFIEANSFSVVSNVPDTGSTLSLLALALAGLVAGARRWQRAS